MHLSPAAGSRLAAAGDWHANTAWARSAVEYAAGLGATTLLQAGDFGFVFRHDYLDGLQESCQERGVEVLAVRGNHDDPVYLGGLTPDSEGLLRLRERVAMIPDGHTVVRDGVSILGLGGAVSVDRSRRTPGTSWWEGEVLPEAVVRRIEAHPPVADVVLCHDGPAGIAESYNPFALESFATQDPAMLDDVRANRERLRRAIDAARPRLVVHGHFHRPCESRLSFATGAGQDDASALVVGLDRDGSDLRENVRMLRDMLPGGFAGLGG